MKIEHFLAREGDRIMNNGWYGGVLFFYWSISIVEVNFVLGKDRGHRKCIMLISYIVLLLCF